jgi:hypothetical protein
MTRSSHLRDPVPVTRAPGATIAFALTPLLPPGLPILIASAAATALLRLVT